MIIKMKFDMHCHTKEGSIDAKVSIEEYIRQLIEKGFDGMLVTDHNSYKGYHKWLELVKQSKIGHTFTVLKGIEYDTSDGGHMLVILPDEVHCKLLELRGMSIAKLEKLVHQLGGILGPAHPYGIGFFALMNNWWVKKHSEIIETFDFIETFNSCTHPLANKKAKLLAHKYKKLQLAGSDAHKKYIVGSACTIFDRTICCNNDLIRAIKEQAKTKAEQTKEDILYREPKKWIKYLGIIGYWLYNKAGAFFFSILRNVHLKKNKELFQ